MGTLKKGISAILIIGSIFSIHTLYSAEVIVDNILVKDSMTFDVVLNQNPNMIVGVQDDVELVVLEDVRLAGGILKSGDTRQVELITETALQPNTQYSLLTLSGTEGSIDFETPAGVEGYKATNFMSMKSEDIESIEILDDRTILVTYRQELQSFNYEFKLFAEVAIEEVRKDDFQLPVLTVDMSSPLLSETDYILMIIDMRDAEGRMIQFDTGIYDFKTQIFEDEMTEEELRDLSMYLDEELSEEDIRNLENSIIEDEVMLNAAPEENEGNIDEMATLISETDPEAGAATGILILLTLIINAFFYRARLKRLSFSL
ncbi:hypothetical protein LAT59_04950 [Candidatus Gracilibacteria bacterium]|nr:hypothetical protein [Candidatus Gracilibacteria bacterium]